MSSSTLLILVVVRPGGCLVVERAGLQAAMQDADEPVGELAQGGVVFEVSGPLLVVIGAGAGRGPQRGLGLRQECVDEPVVVHEPCVHGLFLPDLRVIGLVAA